MEKRGSYFPWEGTPKKGTVATLCHVVSDLNLGFLFQFWVRKNKFSGTILWHKSCASKCNVRFNAKGIENLLIRE
jgi:hypothetical protein